TLAEKRQVKVIVSTESIGCDSLIVITAGIDLTDYRNNPVVLYQHDPDMPVARAETIEAVNSKLVSLVQFPPAGAVAKSDEVFALITNRIINAASIGFD